jgi:hypothetical protein
MLVLVHKFLFSVRSYFQCPSRSTRTRKKNQESTRKSPDFSRNMGLHWFVVLWWGKGEEKKPNFSFPVFFWKSNEIISFLISKHVNWRIITRNSRRPPGIRFVLAVDSRARETNQDRTGEGLFIPNKISGVGVILGLLVHVLPGPNKQRPPK